MSLESELEWSKRFYWCVIEWVLVPLLGHLSWRESTPEEDKFRGIDLKGVPIDVASKTLRYGMPQIIGLEWDTIWRYNDMVKMVKGTYESKVHVGAVARSRDADENQIGEWKAYSIRRCLRDERVRRRVGMVRGNKAALGLDAASRAVGWRRDKRDEQPFLIQTEADLPRDALLGEGYGREVKINNVPRHVPPQ